MNIFESLLTGSQPTGVSPELLETLGKQAATRFLEDGTSLNESIAKLASEHAQLENEHVKRIVEFANNETFQHLFEKSADKNVHFPLADPGVVIRDLKDGGSPKHDGKVLNSSSSKGKQSQESGGVSDYREPNVATSNGSGFSDLESAFSELGRQDQHSGAAGSSEPIAKTAGVRTEYIQGGGHANPVDDVYDQHLRLQAMETKLAEAYETCDLILQDAREDFYKLAKREILTYDGADAVEVIEAVKMASPSDSIAFSVLRPVMERLTKEGALKTQDLEKRAQVRILNQAHPLVVALSGIVKVAQEKINASAALTEVRASLSQTDAFLRSQMG